MEEETIEKCLVGACLSLLQDNEGVVVFVNEERYVVWYDAEEKLLKLDTFNVETYEDIAMTKRIDDLKSGQKIWAHKKPN